MAATRKNAARTTSSDVEPNLRHVWLASLGLLVAARRETGIAAERASAKAGSAVADARNAVRRAEADLRDGIEGVREQLQPKVLKFGSDIEARLAPVLEKLGLGRKAQRPASKARKPAATKPALRRATRKPARGVVKKAAR